MHIKRSDKLQEHIFGIKRGRDDGILLRIRKHTAFQPVWDGLRIGRQDTGMIHTKGLEK